MDGLAEPAVQVIEVEKRFHRTRAVAGVTFDAGAGITGLLGPNGAGKTLELTDIVYTSGPPRGRGTDDGARARPWSSSAVGDHPPCPGGDRQRLVDLPVLRDHPSGLLRLAPPLPSGGPGGASRAVTPAPREPQRHPHRGRRQDRVPPPALPLRAPQDRHVPEALPRHPAQPLGDLADP